MVPMAPKVDSSVLSESVTADPVTVSYNRLFLLWMFLNCNCICNYIKNEKARRFF